MRLDLYFCLLLRINRNILECKFVQQSNRLLRLCVLIETYWNVNIVIMRKNNCEKLVLIETYWNVNDYNPQQVAKELGVLIETYWNVNCFHVPAQSCQKQY